MGSRRVAITHCGGVKASGSSLSGKISCFTHVGYASAFFDLCWTSLRRSRMRESRGFVMSFLWVCTINGASGGWDTGARGSLGLWNINSIVKSAVCFLSRIYMYVC